MNYVKILIKWLNLSFSITCSRRLCTKGGKRGWRVGFVSTRLTREPVYANPSTNVYINVSNIQTWTQQFFLMGNKARHVKLFRYTCRFELMWPDPWDTFNLDSKTFWPDTIRHNMTWQWSHFNFYSLTKGEMVKERERERERESLIEGEGDLRQFEREWLRAGMDWAHFTLWIEWEMAKERSREKGREGDQRKRERDKEFEWESYACLVWERESSWGGKEMGKS